MLKVNNLTCTLRNKILLDNISFHLPKASRLDLIGMNGAGKSTLLRCIAGLILKDKNYGWSGEILLLGKDINEYTFPEKAGILSYVPQLQNHIPPFSVEEFVSFSRYAIDRNSKHKAIERALDITHTAHLKQRQLATLSGGERQLVFLASALAAEPKLLLLDEPSAFLDPAHENFLSTLLKKLQQEGISLIHISHNINRIMQDAEDILALKGGKVLFSHNLSLKKDTKWLNETFNHTFIPLGANEGKIFLM